MHVHDGVPGNSTTHVTVHRMQSGMQSALVPHTVDPDWLPRHGIPTGEELKLTRNNRSFFPSQVHGASTLFLTSLRDPLGHVPTTWLSLSATITFFRSVL